MALHRRRLTFADRAARAAPTLVAALSALAVASLAPRPRDQVPVESNFTTQVQPFPNPAPPTGPPPTEDVTTTETRATPTHTRARSSDRVTSGKKRGPTPESAPTTSQKSERATSGTASSTTSLAPHKATAPPATIAPASDAPRTLAQSCSPRDIEGGAVGWVASAASYIATQTGFTGQLLGRAGRAGNPNSDHPTGHAVDFMGAGDKLADFVLAHQHELGVTYVIWRQRYNDGSGWDRMEDRGSPTANHLDHVHVSFDSTPPETTPSAC